MSDATEYGEPMKYQYGEAREAEGWPELGQVLADAKPARQHVSDAAFESFGLDDLPSMRDDFEETHRRHGTIVVTVEEWDATVRGEQSADRELERLRERLANLEHAHACLNEHCIRQASAEYWVGGQALADRARELLGARWQTGKHVIVAILDEIERLRKLSADREAKDKRLYGPFPNARQRQERAVAELSVREERYPSK